MHKENFDFVVLTLNLLTEIIFTNQKDMNLMISKYKLIDILIKCWNDSTVPSIIQLIVNACLTEYFNTRYSNFRLNLVKSTELMTLILHQLNQSNSEAKKISTLEVLMAIFE